MSQYQSYHNKGIELIKECSKKRNRIGITWFWRRLESPYRKIYDQGSTKITYWIITTVSWQIFLDLNYLKVSSSFPLKLTFQILGHIISLLSILIWLAIDYRKPHWKLSIAHLLDSNYFILLANRQVFKIVISLYFVSDKT